MSSDDSPLPRSIKVATVVVVIGSDKVTFRKETVEVQSRGGSRHFKDGAFVCVDVGVGVGVLVVGHRRASGGGANNVTNGTAFLVKDVNIPAGSSLEILSGGKVILETTDALRIDCSVADKISGTLSIMEIT